MHHQNLAFLICSYRVLSPGVSTSGVGRPSDACAGMRLPHLKHSLQVSKLRFDASAAVCVHCRHPTWIPAVLTESTEVCSVQEPNLHAQPSKCSLRFHAVEHILFLHAFRCVTCRVPLVEQCDGLVVRGHEVEACVDGVGLVERLAIVSVAANLQVFSLMMQLGEWVS